MAAITCFSIFLFFIFQTGNSEITIFYNGEIISSEEGIKLSEVSDPKTSAQLSFSYDNELESKENLRFTIDLIVVRKGEVVRSRKYNEFKEKQTLNVQPTLHLIQPGDNIVIEMTGNLKAFKPRMLGFPIKE